MNILLNIIIFLSAILNISLFASDSLKAMVVPGNVSDISPTSKAWLSASYQDIILYPKNRVNINSLDSNILDERINAKKIRVKVITDGKNISFLIKWADNTKSQLEGYTSTTYGDGYSIEFPTKYNSIKKLPYIDMGSSKRSVVVHTKKASLSVKKEKIYNEVYDELSVDKDNEIIRQYIEEINEKIPHNYQQIIIAEGSNSIREIKDNSINVKMQMLYKNGYWRGTLSRPLKSTYLDIDSGAFPVAFVVWDGKNDSRNTVKLFSSWIGVKIVGKSGGEKFINSLKNDVIGDIKNGEKIAHNNCAVCHHYKDIVLAPDFMAPDLSNIGGYGTKEYLIESMTDPSAIIVEKDNDNKNFTWYFLNDKGSKVSTMPSYNWLDKKSKNDLVSFLMTLKETLKK